VGLVPRHADPLAQQHLVAGTAEADDIDPLGSDRLCRGAACGALGHLHHLGRQNRLVTVDYDVDALRLQYAQIGLHRLDGGGAEQYVLQLCGDQGAPQPSEREQRTD